MPRLFIATLNPAKARELGELLGVLPYELVTPAQVGIASPPPEEGATLEENATAKALYYHRLSGLLTLAEDSGLEVEALGGEPGVRSARFAGDAASDEDNIRLLLHRLQRVAPGGRRARFRCVMAVAGTPSAEDPYNRHWVVTFTGECEGVIAEAPRGRGGFGYDPVFLVPELGQTFAQLPAEVKNRLSHRGRAAREAARFLRKMLVEPGVWATLKPAVKG